MGNMETFPIYKNDWNYPISKQNTFKSSSDLKGKCVTFQEAMKVTLVTGQCFGLNPVIGVCSNDASKLRFAFRSWRVLYTLMSIGLQCSSVLLCFLKMFKNNDATLSSNTSTIFYVTNTFTTVLFLRIAMKWPQLCVEISKTEVSDPNMDASLIKKCNLTCLAILTLAFIEHALSDITVITLATDCSSNLNSFQAFIIKCFPWTFAFVPYNPIIGVVSLFLNIQCTFNWNFSDLFVICMSMYLTSRLNQVNQRLDAVKNQYAPSSFWRTVREDYNRVACLVRLVDDVIGGVVFISFANNLFFICMQLLHTLADGVKATTRCHTDGPDYRPFRGYEHAIYFVYSFGFLLLRWLAVSMAASKVHTASKAPAMALYNVASSTYCIEIQRFLDQVHGDTVSLSGLQFFNVKRGMILSIAGTIVTYELVLMQFTGISPTTIPA